MSDSVPKKGLSDKLEKKRKRQADEPSKDAPKTETQPAPATEGLSKRQKKLQKSRKKQPEQDLTSQDRENGIDKSIGKMDGSLLGDYFAQRAKKLDKELSAVELSDLSIPGMYFCEGSRCLASRAGD
jgi:protein CMS1